MQLLEPTQSRTIDTLLGKLAARVLLLSLRTRLALPRLASPCTPIEENEP